MVTVTIFMEEKEELTPYDRKFYYECSDNDPYKPYRFRCTPTDALADISAKLDEHFPDKEWSMFTFDAKNRKNSELYLTKNYKEKFRTYIEKFISSSVCKNKALLSEDAIKKYIIQNSNFSFPRALHQGLSYQMTVEIRTIIKELQSK